MFNNMPDPSKIHDHINSIINGKLGNLAKELAEETAKDFDFCDEDLKDSSSAFKKLFKNPQKLLNLVKNVGTKLDEKMKSGDIKENELFNLRIKQLTKKSFNSYRIRFVRRQIKHLRNLVTLRVNNKLVISNLKEVCR
jgi:methionyl-tRNA synthetase